MSVNSNSTQKFLAVVIAAIVIRLLLVVMMPMQAMPQMAHDDGLFIRQATSIVHGQWLGPYDQTTLIKGPGYPLFIAACHLVGAPLKLAEHALYVGFCVTLLVAIKPAIASSRKRLLVFAILLFNPMTVDTWMNRTLRESIYPAMVGLVLACAIGVSLRSRSPRVWLWLAALGVSLGGFWIVREEGAWILPGVGLLLGVAAISAWRTARNVRFPILCVIPIATLLFTINAVCCLNFRHYGVWEIVEMKSPQLQAAYGALCRVHADHFDPLVPVSSATRARIYQECPIFAQLRPSLEGSTGRMWAALGATELPDLHGEIAGGWFVFALRDAVAQAGHAHSAIEARDFYARLADEVNAACDRGALPALPHRASLAPPWNRQYAPLIGRAALRGFGSVAGFETMDIDVDPSVGDPAGIAAVRELAHTAVTPVDPGNAGPQTLNQEDSLSIQIWRLIGVAFQFALPWAAGLSLLVLLLQLILLFAGYRSPLLTIELALLLLIVTRIVMLAYLDVAFFPSINTRYLAGAYPLVLLFVCLAMVELVRAIHAMRAQGWQTSAAAFRR